MTPDQVFLIATYGVMSFWVTLAVGKCGWALNAET